MASTTTTTTLDHFQCYEIKPATIPPTTVTVEDQFGTQALTLRFPHRLCAPANKNGEGIFDEIQHLVGYDTLRTPFTKRTGFPVTNQFGTITIDLTRRDLLMVPTAKSLVAPPPPLQPPTIDHFQCYRAKRSAGSPKFAKINVTVADQFESLNLTLLKPYRLCVPASKNDEDPTAPDHPDLLLCYKSKSSTKFGTIVAHIDNQFGPDDVTLIHRRELCVPSFNPEATTTTTTTSTSTTTTTTTPSLCGNGVIDPGETCDTGIPAGPGACPTSCNDGDTCTTDTLSNPGTCTATCTTTPVTVCHSGDGCCPLGCTNANDDDCAPLCMPDCSGKTCGDDGCGGSCGDCTTPGQVCGNISGDGQACCFPPGTMNVCTVDNFVSVCCAAANGGGVGCDFTGGNPGACFN